MTVTPDSAQIELDREQTAGLARLLRQVEQFFDECDDYVEDALAAHTGLSPACEAISAALRLHADTIESTLGIENAASRTST